MRRLPPVVVLLAFAVHAEAADKSHPKSLDPELKIELFAEHPTIVTPTGIDVDYKGRVFAVESNTHFRPKDYKGHKSDRVLVLQDTNGDGKANKTTVFTDGLTHTMSVKVKPMWLDANRFAATRRKERSDAPKRKPRAAPAVESRLNLSVYVATRRDIFLYHDTNNDLKADRRQSIIKLVTKGNYPHNGLAGITFDAMGWMYFGFGENLGAKYTIVGSDGKKLSGGGEGGNVYRCRPDGSKLSLWATGFWNPHASCVDAFGRLFTVDNDPDSRPPCRLLHIIEGGDYGFRFRNGRKGLHPFTAWNGEIPGTLPMVSGTGEAPSGIVAYESDGFPKKYIGNLLVGSWGDHRIDRFVLKPKGASFESRAEPFIQGGEDFRPVGLAVAPDGSLFCTDWVKRDYKLHGHGRVWRISRKKEAKRKVIDLSTITPKRKVKELTALLSHPRLDVRRMASRLIAAKHRAAETKWYRFSDLTRITPNKRREFHEWAMAWYIPSIRKAAGYPPGVHPKRTRFEKSYFAKSFAKAKDTFEMYRLMKSLGVDNATGNELIVEFQKAKPAPKADALDEIQVERIRLACLLAGRQNSPKNSTLPKLALETKNITLRRTAIQWAAEENLKQLKPQVEAVLNGKVMNAELFLATLAALEMLDGKSPKDFDKTPAGKYVLPLVKDAKRSPAVRAQALRLVDPDDKRLDEKLFRELLGAKDATLKLEAVRTLQLSTRPFAATVLAEVALNKSAPTELRMDALAGLTGRSADKVAKWDEIRKLHLRVFKNGGPLAAEVFRSSRQTYRANPVGYFTLLKEMYERKPSDFAKRGKFASFAEEMLLLAERADAKPPALFAKLDIKRPKNVVAWYSAAKTQAGKGDVRAGRRVFFHRNSAGCYKCHTVNGRGGKIGPDLSYIARTASRRKLAESILEPSKEIAPQYTLWSFVMESGNVHHGMILGDTRNGKRQRIGTPEGKTIDLPLTQIELRKPQKKSVMPEKLIDQLTATEFRDLLAYLESLK